MLCRRDDGRTVMVGTHALDNRWVVPYNPFFAAHFGAHINVEICGGVGSVYYLYKYVYKGHDRTDAVVEVRNMPSDPEIPFQADCRACVVCYLA